MNYRVCFFISVLLLVQACSQIPVSPPEPAVAPPAAAATDAGAVTVAGNGIPPAGAPIAIEPDVEPEADGRAPDPVVLPAQDGVAVAGESDSAERSDLMQTPALVDAGAAPDDGLWAMTPSQRQSVARLCHEIGNKLGSVSVEDCLAQPLSFAGAYTVQSRPMVVRDFLPMSNDEERPRILIMGGIHGDEYSSISIMFKWMELLQQSDNRDFRWRFIPAANPDGLLDGQAGRQNANGVDLNRNFPSADWQTLAQDYWATTASRNPRRYPGTHAGSEPEVQWVVEQIEHFKPDVIVSVHAPYHLLDYDGPQEPPEKIGELHLHLLGVYPGSLGNYAGVDLGIPVVTMELPSAGIMPSDDQIASMWRDLLNWLYEHPEAATIRRLSAG